MVLEGVNTNVCSSPPARSLDVASRCSSPAWAELLPASEKKAAPNVPRFIVQATIRGLRPDGPPMEVLSPYSNILDATRCRRPLFNKMHTTALCSPTRSCIPTGRNHHSNPMSCITEAATGYPGYNGMIPFENGFLSEMLR